MYFTRHCLKRGLTLRYGNGNESMASPNTPPATNSSGQTLRDFSVAGTLAFALFAVFLVDLFSKTTEAALEGARAVVVFWSKTANGSHQTNDARHIEINLRKSVRAVQYPNCQMSSWNGSLSKFSGLRSAVNRPDAFNSAKSCTVAEFNCLQFHLLLPRLKPGQNGSPRVSMRYFSAA